MAALYEHFAINKTEGNDLVAVSVFEKPNQDVYFIKKNS